MIGRTNAGIGTGGLIINVVGGLSQPENPTYGTVWLETEVPINGWEILSVAPDWEAAEGHVYLQDAPSTSVDTPNFAVTDAAKKPYGAIWERLIGAFQRINGEWVRLNGAMWRDGVWTPFFSATINITYPAGSTCTATDGVTTLSAPDTSGTWACVVPNAGKWTATVVDKGWADSVAISEDGQTAYIDISAIYLFRSGNQYPERTGGWAKNPYGTANVVFGDDIVIEGSIGGAKYTHVHTANKIQFDGKLSTLIFDIYIDSLSSNANIGYGVLNAANNDDYVSGAKEQTLQSAGNLRVSVDISNVNSPLYVQFSVYNAVVHIKNVRLV